MSPVVESGINTTRNLFICLMVSEGIMSIPNRFTAPRGSLVACMLPRECEIWLPSGAHRNPPPPILPLLTQYSAAPLTPTVGLPFSEHWPSSTSLDPEEKRGDEVYQEDQP